MNADTGQPRSANSPPLCSGSFTGFALSKYPEINTDASIRFIFGYFGTAHCFREHDTTLLYERKEQNFDSLDPV